MFSRKDIIVLGMMIFALFLGGILFFHQWKVLLPGTIGLVHLLGLY